VLLAAGILMGVTGYTTLVWGKQLFGGQSQSWAYLIGLSQDSTSIEYPLPGGGSAAAASNQAGATKLRSGLPSRFSGEAAS
jgi:hypothetical protein